MAFFSVLFALALDMYLALPARRGVRNLYRRFAAMLRGSLDAGLQQHGIIAWLLAVVPLVVVVGVLYRLVYAVNPLLGWFINVAVLYLTLDFKSVADLLSELPGIMRREDFAEAVQRIDNAPKDWSPLEASEVAQVGIEDALRRAHTKWFGVVFWFALLPGPTGALLYSLSRELNEQWVDKRQDDRFGSFARKFFQVLDWFPARLTAVTCAIVGNFEEAVFCWRSQAGGFTRPTETVVLASGAGAMGVRLGETRNTLRGVESRPEFGVGDAPDANSIHTAEGFLWRGIILWVGVLLLLTLVAWIGG
jgi:adenosylcobinamide-phosphate synthase